MGKSSDKTELSQVERQIGLWIPFKGQFSIAQISERVSGHILNIEMLRTNLIHASYEER
jgi:hypothetical protein